MTLAERILGKMIAPGLVLVCAASTAQAITKCNAAVNKKTGAIEVSASGVEGSPVWGLGVESTEAPFFNLGECFDGDKLKRCVLFDPETPAALSPPNSCTIYLNDGAGICKAFIKDCKPSAADQCCDGYSGNTISNTTATVSAGTQIGTNFCNTNTTCP